RGGPRAGGCGPVIVGGRERTRLAGTRRAGYPFRSTLARGHMSDSRPSFLRDLFAGAIEDELLFPYPPPLEARDPDEARVVARLIGELERLEREGVIDSARFDAEEAVSEEALRALAEGGFLGLTIP